MKAIAHITNIGPIYKHTADALQRLQEEAKTAGYDAGPWVRQLINGDIRPVDGWEDVAERYRSAYGDKNKHAYNIEACYILARN